MHRKFYLAYTYDPLQNLFDSDYVSIKNEKDYIPFGEDNLLPQQISKLVRSVTIHRAIINSKRDYFLGSGLVSENKALVSLINQANNNHETLQDVLKKIFFDDLTFGNAYIELVTDRKRSYLFFYHIDSTTVRLAAGAKAVILHPSWADYSSDNDDEAVVLPLFPDFKKMPDGQYHSVYHIKEYEPEFVNYGLPSWYSGLSSVIIAGLTDQWNQHRLENQFNAPGMLLIPGVNTEEEAAALDAKFEEYKGVDREHSHDILIQYLQDVAPGLTRKAAQYIEFKRNEEGNWINLHNQAYNNLLSVHNWYKTLCSFFGERTGFDTHRILNEYEVALNTVIKSFQAKYLKIFNLFFRLFGLPVDQLTFENQSPVYRINPVKYVWELRRDSGLPYDKEDPLQQLFYSQLRNTFVSEHSRDNIDIQPGSAGDTAE